MDFSGFFSNTYDGLLKIFFIIAKDLSLLWLFIPILVLWTATEIYYGEYTREKFSFSSTFTGAISLLWLSFVVLRGFFADGVGLQIQTYSAQVWIAFVFVFYGLFIFYTSFKHVFSEKTMSILASPRALYFASFILILFGVGSSDIDLYSVLGLLIIFIALSFLFTIIKKYWLVGFFGEVEAVEKAGEENSEND